MKGHERNSLFGYLWVVWLLQQKMLVHSTLLEWCAGLYVNRSKRQSWFPDPQGLPDKTIIKGIQIAKCQVAMAGLQSWICVCRNLKLNRNFLTLLFSAGNEPVTLLRKALQEPILLFCCSSFCLVDFHEAADAHFLAILFPSFTPPFLVP